MTIAAPISGAILAVFVAIAGASPAAAQFGGFGCTEMIGNFCVSAARAEFPNTDFSKTSIDLGEIMSGGPPRDGIPPIDEPAFMPIENIRDIAPNEPVVGLAIAGEWRAYPLRQLMWHEIANDRIGDVPVSITFCPLCNAVIVFDRRVDGKILDFGTTGRLRNSDLLMWDRQTESWWQQFTGEAIIGAMTGTRLKVLPSRLESFAEFRDRAPADAQVLIPNGKHRRAYGRNPYVGYDSLARPFLYDGEVPDGIEPLARVVSLEGKREAWSLDLLRQKKTVTTDGGIVLNWSPGQASALDTERISEGRDVGTVIARKDGQDVAYFVDFAFAFHAFQPNAPIHLAE